MIRSTGTYNQVRIFKFLNLHAFAHNHTLAPTHPNLTQSPVNIDLYYLYDVTFPENAEKLLNQEVDLDKAGAGQFYCLHCARHFIDEQALTEHFRTKVHKRRLKALELEPYTIEDSERAAGYGNFKFPLKRKIETQPLPKKSSEQDAALHEDDDITMKDSSKKLKKS